MSTPFDENNSASNNTGADTNPTYDTWQMPPPPSSVTDPNAPSSQPAYAEQYGQYSQAPQQGFPQQGFPQQGYYPGQPGQPMQPGPTKNQDSFFGKLFDLSFKRFVTLDSARLVYILALISIGMLWLLGLVFAFSAMTELADQGATGFGVFLLFLYLIFGSFWSFIQIGVARLGIEALVNLYRTAENTTELVEQGNVDSDRDGQKDNPKGAE